MRAILVLLAIAVFAFADAYDDGMAAAYRGDLQEAVRHLTRALEQNPSNADAYLLRGNSYKALGDRTNAIADFTQAIKFDPHNVESYFNRGVLYAEIGDHPKAIADYTRVIKIDPNFPEAYGGRGSSYLALGDHKKAIEDAKKACDLSECGFMSDRELLQFLRENEQMRD
ncbi:hypothetical protein FACS189487_03520 [Campylobacterota bacterium]|nr:hypothetical protein FACS189487_03520 [Campylobacterota bacterium]